MMADYVKKRTHIINHVRFLDAGPIARDLYDWGMLWSGQQETDGEIPMTALLSSAWGAGGKKNLAVAEKLVDVGLWSKTETGFAICKWAEQGNVTRAELVEKRRIDRERKAESRRSSKPPVQKMSARNPTGFPSSTSYSSSNSDPEIKIPEEIPPRAHEPDDGPPSLVAYREAYAAGVRRGKAGSWSWPGTKYADWDIGKIIKDHCKDPSGKPYKGEQLLRCIEHNAAEFVSDVLERKISQYYSAFSPKGCLKWLNEADMLEEARRVG